jgi:hypothetical protein
MALEHEANALLENAYRKRISIETILAKIDNFILGVNSNSALSKQLKFLKCCLKQVDLYLPCESCEPGVDRLLTPHRPIDHLKKWFFEIIQLDRPADECQAIVNYLAKAKDNPIIYSMLLTIAPVIDYEGYVKTHPVCQLN